MPQVNTPLNLSDFPTGGQLASLATIEAHPLITVAQTTVGQTLTLPSYYGQIFIANAGSVSFNIAGSTIIPNNKPYTITANALNYFVSTPAPTSNPVISQYTQYTAVPVTNTVVETTMVNTTSSKGSLVFPANNLLLNDYFRIKLTGKYTTGSTPNPLSVRLKLGTVVLTLTNLLLPVSQTNDSWTAEYNLRVNSIGVTGNMFQDSEFRFDNGTSSDVVQRQTILSVTIDTTISNTFDLTAQWTTANTDSFDLRSFSIEKL
jgi:hypothetical protein